jgi:hypothetical protein
LVVVEVGQQSSFRTAGIFLSVFIHLNRKFVELLLEVFCWLSLVELIRCLVDQKIKEFSWIFLKK